MKRTIVAGLVSIALASPVLAQESVEVLHWWTSGGEAAALGVLKKIWKVKASNGMTCPWPVAAAKLR